ncbi:hypothetical protein GCM10022225_50100 [Plantactinospora mayteni]|uniref:DUF2178 domain-containing protein n=1 Tax=Plantactinospora mayteni TaxID=566021 RepID=A0ABQ4EXV7_9ACTN|nr:hypothetical protein [Plantactinospora mayteni]GIG99508.1 hypothetical protein Pma05_60810 [Plantactinospora mayteni]
MSYEEKGTWVALVVGVTVYLGYLVIVLGRLAGTPVSTVPYVSTLLLAIGISIVTSIVARIAVEIARPSESQSGDVRDREIHWLGDRIGQRLLMTAALAALGLALFEAAHFWIANVLYLGFVASAVVGSVVKLRAYHRGI